MSNVFGFDIGTMNLVSAKQVDNQIKLSSIRNNYILVDKNHLAMNEIEKTGWSCIHLLDDNGNIDKIAVIGEDAFRMANIMGATPLRCMKNGTISNDEIDSADVIAGMCNQLIGDDNVSDRDLSVFSIPAAPVDGNSNNVLYHEKVFKKIFKSLGFRRVESINESLAIIFNECSNDGFSGIGCSFGGGMVNVATVYKGVIIFSFSVAQSGDWIDQQTAKSLGLLPNVVCHFKEKGVDLLNVNSGTQQEKKVKQSLVFHYELMIENFLEYFVKEFNKNTQGLYIGEEIPLIISGGTSKAIGFLDIFKEKLAEYKEFPYKISQIKKASNELDCVAKGALVYGMFLEQQKKDQQ